MTNLSLPLFFLLPKWEIGEILNYHNLFWDLSLEAEIYK